MPGVKHTYQTALPNDAASEVSSDRWNAEHAIDDNSVAPAKLAVSATDRVIGRSTAGAGAAEEIPVTAAARALLDDASAAAMRTTLGAEASGAGAAAVTTHEGAADPHAGYQREGEKGAASGYASLDATARVPAAQLATGTPDGTKFLRDDRTWQAAATPAINVYTANGTWTKPAGARYVRVRCVGGGGGGGGAAATASGQRSAGAGGGAGGYVEKLYPAADLDATEAVVVGAAGAAGANTGGNGGAGGISSFADLADLIQATGGAGGEGGPVASGATVQAGGPGGVGSGGTINVAGGGGTQGFTSGATSGILAVAGTGGSSALSGGAVAPLANVAGNAGGAYGGGGSGGANGASQVGRDGGAGGAGVVIVEAYF